MKSKILSLAFCLIFLIPCLQSKAQETSYKGKIFKTWISITDIDIPQYGTLYELKDSSVIFAKTVVNRAFETGNYVTEEFYVRYIEKIKFRRKGAAGIGAAVGASAGFLAGFLIGYNSDGGYVYGETKEGLGFSFGILGGITGAILGAAIGSIKLTIPINGNIHNYNAQKKTLRKRALSQQ